MTKDHKKGDRHHATHPNSSDITLSLRHIDNGYKLAARVIHAGVIVFVAWQARLSIEALAGGETSVKLFIDWIVGGKGALTGTSLLFGAGGIGYGLRERHLKKYKTVAMTRHIADLERRLDPNRTSSGLAATGETNPDDR